MNLGADGIVPIPLAGSQLAASENRAAAQGGQGGGRSLPSSVETDAVERPTAAFFARTALEQAATEENLATAA